MYVHVKIFKEDAHGAVLVSASAADGRVFGAGNVITTSATAVIWYNRHPFFHKIIIPLSIAYNPAFFP